jgi:hypothetical protein
MPENNNCPCNCSECFLLGDSVPDWPQRKVCKKLDAFREQCWEDEGGAVKKEESKNDQE